MTASHHRWSQMLSYVALQADLRDYVTMRALSHERAKGKGDGFPISPVIQELDSQMRASHRVDA
jgi:hypothetical protein